MHTLPLAVALTLMIVSTPGKNIITDAVRSLDPNSQVEPAISRMPLMLERKPVFDIPPSIVRFARPASWTPAMTRQAAPRSALRVSRMRPATNATCGTFYDTIDLIAVRRNNFRLVGFDVEALPVPGFALQSPAEGLAIDTSTRDTPTFDLPRAGQIRIRPPIHASIKQPGACVSRYRVSITLEGPRGADPFAGIR